MNKFYLHKKLLLNPEINRPVDPKGLFEGMFGETIEGAIKVRKNHIEGEVYTAIENIERATGPEILELMDVKDKILRSVEAAPDWCFTNENGLEAILHMSLPRIEAYEEAEKSLDKDRTERLFVKFVEGNTINTDFFVHGNTVSKKEMQEAVAAIEEQYHKKVSHLALKLDVITHYGDYVQKKNAYYDVNDGAFRLYLNDTIISLE